MASGSAANAVKTLRRGAARFPRTPLACHGFDAEACARSALGPHWQNTTAPQRQEYANRYEDYIVIVYSTLLGHLSGESITVLGSQPNEEGVIVTSRLNGIVPSQSSSATAGKCRPC